MNGPVEIYYYENCRKRYLATVSKRKIAQNTVKISLRPVSFALAIAAFVLLMLASPAWSRQNEYQKISASLRRLDSAPYAKVEEIGKSAEGRPIYAIFLTSSEGPVDRMRLLVLCGQHGNEPAAASAMIELAEEMANTTDPKRIEELKKAVTVIVPAVNPDGLIRRTRHNANGIDLNRDWIIPTQPETRAVTRLIERLRPHVILDEHQWTDPDEQPSGIEMAGYGSETHLKLGRLLARGASADILVNGSALKLIPYSQNTSMGLAHRHFASQGICSMLLETSAGLSADRKNGVYKAFTSRLISILASPPGGPVTQTLQTTVAMNRSMDIRLPVLMADKKKTPGFPYWLVMLAAACYFAIRYSYIAENEEYN